MVYVFNMQKIINLIAILCYCFLAYLAGIFSYNSEFVKEVLGSINNSREKALYGDYPKNFADKINVWVDDTSKLHNELLLISTHYIDNPSLFLIDNKGDIKHSWNINRDIINPEILRFWELDVEIDKSVFGVVDAHLFSNGDVLVANDLREFNNYRGISLMRLDLNSNILWQIAGQFHHDFDVAENNLVYVLDFQLNHTFPLIDLTDDKVELLFLTDVINIIDTADGKIIDKISVPSAFKDSNFAYFLNSFVIDEDRGFQRFYFKDNQEVFDILHTNSVQFISKKLAEVSPFKEGDLLISMRGINGIAVIRPDQKKVVWAKTGPWRNQHYARLHEDGLIYIYDNEGAVKVTNYDTQINVESSVRVMTFNPKNEEINTVFYMPEYLDHQSYFRGFYTRLGNGTSLISSAESSRILQVDQEGKIVWEMRAVPNRKAQNVPYLSKILSVRNYPADYFEF